MYYYLTTGELVEELEYYVTQVTALSTQFEKLLKLRKEGKIGDEIYAELSNEIGRKLVGILSLSFELIEAARSRVKELMSEICELKYRLERLEGRHMVDIASEKKYLSFKEELLKKMNEDDETMLHIEMILSKMEELYRTIENHLKEATQTTMFRFPATTSRSNRSEFLFKKDISIISISKMNRFTDYECEEKKLQDGGSNVKEFCSACGAENPSFARFCFSCGTRLTSVNKGFDTQEAEKIKMRVKEDLLKMGKNKVSMRNSLVRNCPSCGRENLTFSKYCYNCNSFLLNEKSANSIS